MLVDEMNGEAHDVEIGAVHACASDVTDPLLNTIRAGFVERTIVGDVVVDLVVT